MGNSSSMLAPYKTGTQRKRSHRSSLEAQGKLYSEPLMGYEIVNVPRDRFSSLLVDEMDQFKNRRVFTINPHSFCISKVDREFKDALHDAEFVIPDGTGIALASIVLGQTITKRITGTDIFMELSQKLNDKNQNSKFAFFGSTENTLGLIKDKFTKEFPNVKISTMISPPYRKITEEENEAFCNEINKSGADVLWVSLTAPKQEKWIHNNIHRLNVKIVVPIGAAFDFYAGTVKRSSLMWRRLGLEWLPRLILEPHRLWKRNFISTPTFLFILLKEKLKKMLFKKKKKHKS